MDDTAETEPVELRCSEQPELLSLIISGEEEEEAQEGSDLGGKHNHAVILVILHSWERARGCQ